MLCACCCHYGNLHIRFFYNYCVITMLLMHDELKSTVNVPQMSRYKFV